MLYDGKNTYLYDHPNPPVEFSARPGSNGALSSPGLHEQVRANTMINFNGVWTATVMLPLINNDNLIDQAAVCIHEMFHVFQMQCHPGWFANEAELFMYPVIDSHLLALKRVETEMLVRASSALNEADLVGWSKAAMATRQQRFALLASGAMEYDRHIEGTEGLAQYIQVKASGNPDGVITRPAGGFEPDRVRQSAYYSGIHLGLILDRLMPGWREQREKQDTLNLDDLLNITLTKRNEPAYNLPGDEMQAYEKQAQSDTLALVEARQHLFAEFLDAPGWSIEVLAASNAPLFPLGFDPMNLCVIDSKQVIHQRYGKLGNAAGQIEILDRWMLSIGKGSHPLFEGVIRALITGLKEEPKLVDKDGVLYLSSKGINATFRGAHLKRESQRITVILSEEPGK